MKKFIRHRYLFVGNLIHNKRRSNGKKIIRWYLLTKLQNNNDKDLKNLSFIYFYNLIHSKMGNKWKQNYI